MFRSNSGIIETGRDRVGMGNLAMLVLQQIGLVTMQNTGQSGAERRGVFAGLDAETGGFNADNADRFVFKEWVEQPQCITPPTDAGHQIIRQTPFAQVMLGTMFTSGNGVSQDYAEAVKWFRLAAQQGDGFAQATLGIM